MSDVHAHGDEGDDDELNPNMDSPQSSMTIYPSMPMHMYPFGTSLLSSGLPQMRAKRRQVKNACTNCQKACKKCDDARPCLRCVKYGIAEECVDSQRKERKKGIKRGPYKKRDGKHAAGDHEQVVEAEPPLPVPPGPTTHPPSMPPPYSHIAPVPYTTYYPQYPQQYKPGQVAPQAPPQYYQQYFLAPIPHHMGHPLSQAPAYAQVLNHNGTPPAPTMIAHGQPQDMSHVHHAHANGGNPNGNGNVNGHVNNAEGGNVDPNTPSPHPPHALSGHVVYAAPHPQHPAYAHPQALPQAHAHGQPQYYPAVFTPYPQHYGQPYYTHPAHAQMQPRSEAHAHGPPQGYTQVPVPVPQYAPTAPYAYTHSPIYPSHVTTAKLSPVPVQAQNGVMNGVVERGQMQHGGHGHSAEEGETV